MDSWSKWWVGVEEAAEPAVPAVVGRDHAAAVPHQIACARCEEHMATMEADSVDAVVTDPPYGLAFMGKDWDRMGHGNAQQAWHYRWAVEALRVLKPGGYLVAFGGTRTYHRLACAVEDAGFEIRDSLHWLYGQGFPKSLDVSKAIDKAAGAKRTVKKGDGKAGAAFHYGNPGDGGFGQTSAKASGSTASTAWETFAPATPEATQWDGWGTALKPGHEPIVLARKPLIGTVASNVLEHGTGGINIDGCRVATQDSLNGGAYSNAEGRARRSLPPGDARSASAAGAYAQKAEGTFVPPEGRWPPNVLLSHGVDCTADRCTLGCPVAEINGQSGPAGASAPVRGSEPSKATETEAIFSERQRVPGSFFADSGGAARFFPIFDFDPAVDAPFLYTPKASTQEREQGRPEGHDAKRWNNHPTVKPVSIMRWLVRLVTPQGGVVLDPFTGSGTTLMACAIEGVSAVGIEERAEYAEIARRRVAAVKEEV